MDEQKAHDLYVRFSDVHAAAKSGRGLGFNISDSTARAVDPQNRWQHDAHNHSEHVDSSRPKAVSHSERWSQAQSRGSEHETAPKHFSSRHSIERDQQTERHHASERGHEEEQQRSNSKLSHRKRYRDEERHRHDRDYDERDYKRHDSGHGNADEERPRRDRHSRSDRERRSSGHHDRDSRDQAHRDRESLHDRHHSRDDRSREQHRSSKSSGQRVGDASMPAKKSHPDFEREMPGYAKMTPAERMKARTKLLLSRSAKQDLNEARDGQWTRYVFNKDALLDEEGATPAGGFSGDANTVSLRLPQAQAETKQHMQTAERAHEAAIFGKSSSAGLPGSQGQQDNAPSLHVGLGLGASFANGAGGRELDSYPEPVGSKPVPAVSMVAADVLGAQPGISWRERAALKKKQLSGQDQ